MFKLGIVNVYIQGSTKESIKENETKSEKLKFRLFFEIRNEWSFIIQL